MKPLVYKKASRSRTQAKPERMKLHITKGDVVQVISGDEKGKRGRVLRDRNRWAIFAMRESAFK